MVSLPVIVPASVQQHGLAKHRAESSGCGYSAGHSQHVQSFRLDSFSERNVPPCAKNDLRSHHWTGTHTTHAHRRSHTLVMHACKYTHPGTYQETGHSKRTKNRTKLYVNIKKVQVSNLPVW